VDSIEKWRWTFCGFESIAEGRPVQIWFNSLSEVERDEITDLLVYLQNMTASLWRRPEFDPLNGDVGISEIRVPELRLSKKGKIKKVTYRIYGFHGPTERTYTFLHATDKEVKNDKLGKSIARARLFELRRGAATIHKFDFEGKLDPKAVPRRQEGPN
jgi:hypothetical protein